MPSRLRPAILASLLIPTLVALAALRTGWLPLKLGVPGTCAALLLAWPATRRFRGTWALVGAFVFSMVGDAFLSTKAGRESFYIAGIAAFLVAHLGYIGFAWCHGRTVRWLLGLLLCGYGGWFLVQLGPAIPSAALGAAAFAYLVISCLSLAAAAGPRLPPAARVAYLAGITSIVFSDTIIALRDFLQVRDVGWLILPTYYLAHLLVTLATMIAAPEREGRDTGPEGKPAEGVGAPGRT